jgi:Holliday junction resolvasome RuvABC DNA-binding subunit
MLILKPTKIDSSFLYICPKEECKNEHWLFLREVQTKNFKVVCDCGVVFKPKTIKKISIKYSKLSPKISNTKKDNIPVDSFKECVTTLVGFGFSKNEAKDLLKKAYESNPTSDSIELIKLVLQSLEINNV